MEGAHPHASGSLGADELVDALLHLTGGLVREGERQDLVGTRLAGGQQVGDAVRQHARLARARPSDDQHRPVDGLHGFLLSGIEPLQNQRGLFVLDAGVEVVGRKLELAHSAVVRGSSSVVC